MEQIRNTQLTESFSETISQNTRDFLFGLLFKEKEAPTIIDDIICDVALSCGINRNDAYVRVEAQKKHMTPYIKYNHIFSVENGKTYVYDFVHYAYITDKVICDKWEVKKDGADVIRENKMQQSFNCDVWNKLKLSEEHQYFEKLETAINANAKTI